MDPSSPPVKRTLHLLKTPDILLANDSGQAGSYQLNTSSRNCLLNGKIIHLTKVVAEVSNDAAAVYEKFASVQVGARSHEYLSSCVGFIAEGNRLLNRQEGQLS
jgi:hypothetical protein